MSVHVPDDPRIDTYGQDSGVCGNCGLHIDSGRCQCPAKEREEEPIPPCRCRGDFCTC